jgi:hypothetical protein
MARIQLLVVRTEVFNSIPLREFLKLEKYASDVVVNTPTQVVEFKGFIHGVRDFCMDSSNRVMFIINSDMSVLNRLDAYMTNMKFPWENKKWEPTAIPVGVTECWL